MVGLEQLQTFPYVAVRIAKVRTDSDECPEGLGWDSVDVGCPAAGKGGKARECGGRAGTGASEGCQWTSMRQRTSY